MTDITQILLAIITLVTTLVTTLLVPWIRSKTTTAQQEQLLGWVKIAVAAAEQLYDGVGRGEEKKDYVIAWLTDRGLKFDEATINAAIEAAVYGLGK